MAKTRLFILLVDDNRQFTERMTSLLREMKEAGEINVAADYNEALDFLNTQMPDLILLDINLPDKSGIELLKTIRRSGRNCKVIIISNHAADYYQEQCRQSGADYFLDKSNDFSLLPDLIRNLNLTGDTQQ